MLTMELKPVFRKSISADDLNTDNFKATTITMIPGSSLAIIVALDFGAYFLDLESNEIVQYLQLAGLDLFET